MHKVVVCEDNFTAVTHVAYILLIRPILIGCAIVTTIASICLSASALTGMISSSLTTESFSCEEEIAYGEDLLGVISRNITLDAIMIKLDESSKPDRMLSQMEWQALLYDVESKLEALQLECEEAEST